MTRGRPAVTRGRAFHWLNQHYPCTQGAFIRVLHLERSQARRLWKMWHTEFCPVPQSKNML